MMDERLKGKLDSLFDEGLIAEADDDLLSEISADPDASAYHGKLMRFQTALADPPPVGVPGMFRANVISHLPRRRNVPAKATIWQDLVMPLYIAAVLVVSFIFRDLLGISAFLEMAADMLSTLGNLSAGMEIAFMVISSVGILIAAWAIVAGFFGIRSRRITR